MLRLPPLQGTHRSLSPRTLSFHTSYDGDGRLVKIATSRQPDGQTAENNAAYQLRSSVFGGEVISETSSSSQRRTFIRADGTVVAIAYQYVGTYWTHKDPAMHSMRSTDSTGWSVTSGYDGDIERHELDSDGASVPFSDPYGEGYPPTLPNMFESGNEFTSRANGQSTSFAIDGVEVPVSYFMEWMDSGRTGGLFGLAEWQMRNIRDYSVRYRGETRTYEASFSTEEEARNFAVEMHQNTVYRNIVIDDSWSIVRSIFAFQTTPPPTPQTQQAQAKSCVFNINLIVKNTNLTKEQIDKIKAKMQEIFAQSGHTLVFNDEKAASATEKGSYNLTLVDHYASDSSEEAKNLAQERQYTDNPTFRFNARVTIGYTPSSLFGGVKDNGTVSTYWTKYAMYGHINNPNSEESFIAAVAGTAVHEACHYFLRKILGTVHSEEPDNLMSTSAGLDGSEGFTKTQRKALAKWCNKN